MKKALLIILSVFLVISVAGVSAAQDKDRTKEKPRVIQRTGEVAAVDVAAKSLTLKPLKYKEDIVVTINENTLVKMNKEKKSLNDIKVGDTVKVWFFEKDKTAKSVEIKPVKTEKTDTGTAKPAPKK